MYSAQATVVRVSRFGCLWLLSFVLRLDVGELMLVCFQLKMLSKNIHNDKSNLEFVETRVSYHHPDYNPTYGWFSRTILVPFID